MSAYKICKIRVENDNKIYNLQNVFSSSKTLPYFALFHTEENEFDVAFLRRFLAF